jgi:hypothetical protein
MGETPPAATPQQTTPQHEPTLDEIPRRVRQAFKLWDKAHTRKLAHREVQKFLEALGVTVDGEAVRSGIRKYGAGADGTLGPQECNQLYHELLATQAAAVAAAVAAADATADAADAATAADASSAVAKARGAPAGQSGADGIQRAVLQLRAEIQRPEAYGEQEVTLTLTLTVTLPPPLPLPLPLPLSLNLALPLSRRGHAASHDVVGRPRPLRTLRWQPLQPTRPARQDATARWPLVRVRVS